ncbi:hypothetical protein OSTOST_14284, partial [Ostertagia ostertagi]
EHNGVANMWVRFAMRLAAKWAAGDMGETIVDNVVRSLATLQYHPDMAHDATCQFMEDYKTFCKSSVVSDDIFKRLLKVAWVNSFSLVTDFGTPIGVALCIRLSVENNGVANMWVRFAMRLAAKWAAGDMGETTVDNGM